MRVHSFSVLLAYRDACVLPERAEVRGQVPHAARGALALALAFT